MRINFRNGKFFVEAEMDFEELKKLQPFPAVIAEWDLKDSYQDLQYSLVDGNLYAHDEKINPTSDKWWFYDHSVRRWSECDNPHNPQ